MEVTTDQKVDLLYEQIREQAVANLEYVRATRRYLFWTALVFWLCWFWVSVGMGVHLHFSDSLVDNFIVPSDAISGAAVFVLFFAMDE